MKTLQNYRLELLLIIMYVIIGVLVYQVLK